ncbi:uncharacterized protein LOC114262502 [Camellia sinensis]|uniref:uncharacterized protein LOC114262502 n=1 Tax=Camellia sinensis TaxID=4442 RepID=UPI0010360502|nr:uncharacterized protein LOC114262502 [Camellia sinensis]
MPQDGLRSAVYRSFIICDDPKGVIECKTIRKSKTNPNRSDEKGKNRRNPRNLNSSSAFKEESMKMGSKNVREEDSDNPWSVGMTIDGHSTEIAKDLLKGALDLQESLIMLGKLQDKLWENRKEKSRGDRIGEVGIERTKSHHFQDHNSQMGFEKPGFSADGCSRDCFEELRTVIRDGLARQNLLLPSCTEKKAYCDKRTLDSGTDIASTSSSQSFQGFASSDSSLSSNAPHKSKGSNLIAKLMGLEEIPSETVQICPQKKLESKMISFQRRPMFEIDMPKARKSHSADYKVDTEQKKLKEIVKRFENMQFEGLVNGNSDEGFGLQSHRSDASNSKKRYTEDAPPIVIIKPLQFSSVEVEETRLQKFLHGMGALNSKKVLGELKMQELQAPATGHCEEGFSTGNLSRRHRGEETPVKRLGREGVKNSEGIQAKAEEKVVQTNDKLSSNELKAFVLPSNQQEKKKVIGKKVDRIQKVALRAKKPEEMEKVKSKAVSKSRDEAKVTSTKQRKPETGSIIAKSCISQQKSTSSSGNSKHTTPAISCNRGDREKNLNNEKPSKEPLAANSVVENVGCKYGDKSIGLSCENESDMTRTGTTTADQLLPKERTDSSEFQSKDQYDSNQNSICNVIPQTTQHESFTKSSEEANHCINSTEKKCFRTEANVEDLLLSSPLFLSYAEEHFNINDKHAIVLQKTSSNDSGIADARFLVDCAKELVQHKSLRCSQTKHPLLLASLRCSKISISLAKLVEEVRDGIENLRSYSKHAGEKLVLDLESKGVMSGAWDLGWRHDFTVDEVEQVVGDIEKLLFKELIEDLFADCVL